MHTTRFTCYKNAKYTAFLHFLSEKFTMTISLKDCSLLVKFFYNKNGCAPEALKKFGTLKSMKKGVGQMIVQGLLKKIH